MTKDPYCTDWLAQDADEKDGAAWLAGRKNTFFVRLCRKAAPEAGSILAYPGKGIWMDILKMNADMAATPKVNAAGKPFSLRGDLAEEHLSARKWSDAYKTRCDGYFRYGLMMNCVMGPVPGPQCLEEIMRNSLSRREFIQNTSLVTAAIAAGTGLAVRAGANAADAPAPAAGAAPANLLPAGKIGNLNITRLILGGNLLTRYTHARDLGYVRKLIKSYNSDSKIRETIELAEASGINTLSVNVTQSVCKTLNDHRKNGGKIQWILYATGNMEDQRYKDDVQKMADDGTDAIYIWGVHADNYVAEGKFGVLAKTLEDIKLHNIPCGIGAHDLKVVEEVEKNQLPADFYIKTLHHHNYPTAPKAGTATKNTSEVPGYWCRNPEETVAFMKTVKKPWIAFKIMAAGAIPPKDAFNYAFSSGADFALAGMFDFDVVEDCQLTKEAVAQAQGRARAWA